MLKNIVKGNFYGFLMDVGIMFGPLFDTPDEYADTLKPVLISNG